MFELEHRYIVFKIKDVLSFDEKAPSTPSITSILNWCAKRLTKHREDQNRQELKCIVIESDWPEYPLILEMLRNRVEAPKLKLVFENQQQLTNLGNACYYETLNGYCADMFYNYVGGIPLKFDRYIVFVGGFADRYFFNEPFIQSATPTQIREFLAFLEQVRLATTKVKFDMQPIRVQERKSGDWYKLDGKLKIWNGNRLDPEYPGKLEWFRPTKVH